MNEVSKHATAFSWIRISKCASRKDAECRRVYKKEVCRVQRSVQVCIMMVKRNKI